MFHHHVLCDGSNPEFIASEQMKTHLSALMMPSSVSEKETGSQDKAVSETSCPLGGRAGGGGGSDTPSIVAITTN